MKNSALVKIVVTGVVAIGAIVFFATTGLSGTREYKMVDQLMAGDLPRFAGKEMQVHGWVHPGSIQEKVVDQQTYRTFLLEKGGKKIRVFSHGPKPDTFKDQSECVATGKLVPADGLKDIAGKLGAPIEADAAYVFEATEPQAKCPSKYEGANVNKNFK